MVSYIGNNIKPKGIGLIPPRKVIEGGYRTIIGNGSGLFSQYPFIVGWTVSGDTTARTVTLPLVNGYNYNCVIDWDDGEALSLVTSYNDANRIHTYTYDGTYYMKVYGTMEGWSFDDGGDKLKITSVSFGSPPDFDGFKYLAGGFRGCANLIDLGTLPIPASGNGIESDGFLNTFRETAIVTVPSGFFDQHTNITNNDFARTFQSCEQLEVTPSGLLRNSNWNYFYGCFIGCLKHQQNADLFYNDGEQSTIFVGRTCNFTNCFNRISFTGTQGTAPDLWNCSFGSVVSSGCWDGAGNSLVSLDNYGSVPSGWK